jgi:transposase-like protein
MKKRKIFTEEFKREAVRQLEKGDRVGSELARELGINRNQLYKWQQQINAKGGEAFPGKGRQSGSAAEIARLKRELERVTEERDILKKAAQFFAKESG